MWKTSTSHGKRNRIAILSIVQEDPLLTSTLNKCRHIRCSPSSAQWIIHPDFKPIIDKRSKYNKKYKKMFENKFTKAWLKLIKKEEGKKEEGEDSTIRLLDLE